MTGGRTVGKLMGKCNEFTIEWEIENFFSYTTTDDSLNSPRNAIFDSQCYLTIYPRGETGNSEDWISLYLNIEGSNSTPKGVCFDMGLKKVDGTYESTNENASWVFSNKDDVYGMTNFVTRSELLQRKSELLPSDVLTVFCILRLIDSSDNGCISRKNTLSHDLMEMYISKKDCDVVLKVQEQEFAAHKFILSSRSTVFSQILDNGDTGIVEVKGFSPNAVRDLLLYLYSGKFQNESKDAIEVYRIAEEYNVENLKSACAVSIMSELSVENICEAAVLADSFRNHDLENKIKYFFNDNIRKIISTDKWMSLLRNHSEIANDLLESMVEEKDL